MVRKLIKKVLTIFASLFLVLVIVTGSINIVRAIARSKDDYSFLNNKANKVILFIGDGMGQNQIHNASIYLERDLFFMSFEKKGEVTTHSKNTYWSTDSAASATAMATGKKVYNTHVGSDFNKTYTSITELAKQNGLGAGIVTTDTLVGATPASFSSHALKRSYAEDIINSQLENNIDLYLGAGNEIYSNYKEQFIEKGYAFISNSSELVQTNSKILGSFGYINNYEVKEDMPTLPMLVKYAIDYFEANYPDGYFLMIEGAHIDKSNHANNINNMISYLDEFDNSIKLAKEILGTNEDVCFIVTADHESGNLSKANNKEEISDNLYKSTNHTSKNVYYLISQKNNEEINKINKRIDNTHIFKMCKELLGI